MYRIIKEMIHDTQDVEDVLNEAFMPLIKNISTIKNLNPYSLRKYVVSTTRTTTINYIVKRKKQALYEFSPPDELFGSVFAGDQDDIEGILVQQSEIQLLKDALLALPKYEYEILFMREYDGLDDSEIARILGKKENIIRAKNANRVCKSHLHVY